MFCREDQAPLLIPSDAEIGASCLVKGFLHHYEGNAQREATKSSRALLSSSCTLKSCCKTSGPAHRAHVLLSGSYDELQEGTLVCVSGILQRDVRLDHGVEYFQYYLNDDRLVNEGKYPSGIFYLLALGMVIGVYLVYRLSKKMRT